MALINNTILQGSNLIKLISNHARLYEIREGHRRFQYKFITDTSILY